VIVVETVVVFVTVAATEQAVEVVVPVSEVTGLDVLVSVRVDEDLNVATAPTHKLFAQSALLVWAGVIDETIFSANMNALYPNALKVKGVLGTATKPLLRELESEQRIGAAKIATCNSLALDGVLVVPESACDEKIAPKNPLLLTAVTSRALLFRTPEYSAQAYPALALPSDR